MNNSLMLAKKALREKLKHTLKSLPEVDRLNRSNNLIKKLTESPQYLKSKRIAIYLSMPEEVDMSELMKKIFENNKVCFIPQYNKNIMRMLQLYSLEDFINLPTTKWNIKQPSIEDMNRDDALLTGGLDLVVVPGLGFTKSGKRLGRGKGYYDRFMKEVLELYKQNLSPLPYFVALAFQEQIFDDIPVTQDDFIVDEVIIE